MSSYPYLVSVCITSYKRVKELERCLKSIDSKQTDNIEVIVSEDCSPQREEIRKVVNKFAEHSPYHVVFNTNEQNLGYDCNLKKLATLASGEYILYMSDDDCFFPGKLDEFLKCLYERHPALAYGSFLYGYEEEKRPRRKYSSSHVIKSCESSVSMRVYDAILFSGLTFRTEYIKHVDAERFKNLNYFQVYLFLSVMYQYGGYYNDVLLIDSVSDGENAYGQVTSLGDGNSLLADRESVFSNLEFNRGLFKVIQMFDEDYGTHVFGQFSKEYSLRSFGGFCRARRHGLSVFWEYWKRLRTSGINVSVFSYVYFIIVGLLGTTLSKKFFVLPRMVLMMIRKHD